MGSGHKHIPSSFAEIKRNLDPAYGYMVFEKAVDSEGSGEFEEIIPLLSRIKKGVFEHVVHRDKVKGRLVLVVKLEPNLTDKVTQEFLNIMLPKDITLYVYGSRPEHVAAYMNSFRSSSRGD